MFGVSRDGASVTSQCMQALGGCKMVVDDGHILSS